MFQHEPRSLGHAITLVARHYPAHHANDNGIKRVAARPVPLDSDVRMLKSGAVGALIKQLQTAQFDRVHHQTPSVAHYFGVKLARRMAIACIETYHTFFEEYLYHDIVFVPRGWLRCLARRFARDYARELQSEVIASKLVNLHKEGI